MSSNEARTIPVLDGGPGCLRFVKWLADVDEKPTDARLLARHLFEHPAGHTGPIARELGLQKLEA